MILFAAFTLNGQTFEKDLEKVYKNFINTSKISYSIKYVLKENHSPDSRTISESSGKYLKEKDKYINVLDHRSTLVTNNEIVIIDNQSKFIRVKKVAGKMPEKPDFLSQLTEYNENIDKVTQLSSTKKNVVVYRVDLKANGYSPVSYYELAINAKTNYVERISLYYSKPLNKNEEYKVTGKERPRLDIIFYDFNNTSHEAQKELSSNYYYIKNQNKLSPTFNFKGYDVKEIF